MRARRSRRRVSPDLVVVIVALASVGALQLAATFTVPPLVALGDAPAHGGARVVVEGLALGVSHGAHGRSIVLAKDGWRLTALATDAVGPARGDTVRAVGVVDGDHLSADQVVVTLPAATRALDPSDLAARPLDFVGARVLVRGDIKAGPSLAGGGARVAVVGVAPPSKDGAWLATGTFYYSEADATYKLTVESWASSS